MRFWQNALLFVSLAKVCIKDVQFFCKITSIVKSMQSYVLNAVYFTN